MGVTVQVRDLDPSVNERLKRAAAAKGLSYSEYLRRELTRIAERMRIDERWSEVKAAHEARLTSALEQDAVAAPNIDVSTDEILRLIREGREGR